MEQAQVIDAVRDVAQHDEQESVRAPENTRHASRMSASTAMRRVQTFAAPVLVLLLVVALLGTMYVTRDLQWVAFLAGVLFAAVAAMASHSARAQWLIARRTAQLERIRKQFAEANAQNKFLSGAAKAAEARLRLIADALPEMIVYIDADARCRYHNHSFQRWCGRSDDAIDGYALSEVGGEAVFKDLQSHAKDSASGGRLSYETSWPRPQQGNENVFVTLLPDAAEGGGTGGYYALIGTQKQAMEHEETLGNVVVLSEHNGETAYLQSMTEQLIGGADPRGRLVQAIEEDQFILFGQKMQPLSGNVHRRHCVEVLLRLREEEENLLPPGGFFPVAERYNLMGNIDRWVLRTLLKHCAARPAPDDDRAAPLYCVNLSPASLSDPAFPQLVRAELGDNHVPGSALCFEVAETDLAQHRGAVCRLMAMLKPIGCSFTVDGFGAVKVSFTSLQGLHFDFLKIDGAIIQNIGRERLDLAKVRAIVGTCRRMGMSAIAGCVESSEVLAVLRSVGVDYVQGFGVARPKPLAQVSVVGAIPA